MRRLRTVLFFVALFAIWEGLCRMRFWDAAILPSPIQVGSALRQMLRDGTLAEAAAVSLRRVFAGYAASLLMGIPIGVGLARSRFLADTVGALLAAALALPSICWLPLALLWFGLNDQAIVFVVVMGSFVTVASTVQDGVKSLSPNYVRAARTMGAEGLELYCRVLLPASLPTVLTAAKQGWSYAWRALMAGELLFATLGLGHLLTKGRELSDMSIVVAVMIVIVALGLFVDRMIFASLTRVVGERFGFEVASQ